jgi:hypothetical protein
MNASNVHITDPHMMGGWFAPFANRKYCLLFFWIMVVSAVMLVLHVGTALYKIVSSGGKLYAISNPMFWTLTIMQIINYFTNRLLYSMCLNSV